MEFSVSDNNLECGSSFKVGEITACYADLVQLFGEPYKSDDHKVSGIWYLKGDNGEVITVYDWKSTDLYCRELPSIEEFRKQKLAKFSIGGFSEEDAKKFNAWMNVKLVDKFYQFNTFSEEICKFNRDMNYVCNYDNTKINI